MSLEKKEQVELRDANNESTAFTQQNERTTRCKTSEPRRQFAKKRTLFSVAARPNKERAFDWRYAMSIYAKYEILNNSLNRNRGWEATPTNKTMVCSKAALEEHATLRT